MNKFYQHYLPVARLALLLSFSCNLAYSQPLLIPTKSGGYDTARILEAMAKAGPSVKHISIPENKCYKGMYILRVKAGESFVNRKIIFQ